MACRPPLPLSPPPAWNTSIRTAHTHKGMRVGGWAWVSAGRCERAAGHHNTTSGRAAGHHMAQWQWNTCSHARAVGNPRGTHKERGVVWVVHRRTMVG